MDTRNSMCIGCGVSLPACDGPVHRYMASSSACWAKYGELLAREYQNPEYMAAHGLTVDTYAVQHSGRPSPQSVQSVVVHLISLHAVLESGASPRQATDLIRRCTDRVQFEWLEPPGERGALTVLYPLEATTAPGHCVAVRQWAHDAWVNWAKHHAQVRAWAAAYAA